MSSLRFGYVQIAVLAVFLSISLLFALLFVLVARRSTGQIPYERVRVTAYRLRKGWLLLLAATLASALAALSFFLPYASGGPGYTDVRVVAGQFYWSLFPSEFRRGERVRFDVTSVDVNHGFGLYDPRGRLIGSVQVMPGYHNRLSVTLAMAGRYTVACLEFCGLSHHVMIREFTVSP